MSPPFTRPSFGQFLFQWRLGTLDEDATWRNYNIKDNQADVFVKKALKEINLGHAGEHGVSEAMRRYDIKDRHEAEAILSGWWIWSELTMGRRIRGVVIKTPQSLRHTKR
jgi:hypothetical protein